MKFNLNDRWFTRLISLILALLLFTFVAYDNSLSFRSVGNTSNMSYASSEVISNVPVEVRVDEEEYFVSGVPESVTVRLDGPQAVLVQTVVTQDFTVTTPNLNTLGEGIHQVPLEIEGISEQLAYSISPPEVQLHIEEKVTEVYEPNIQFSETDFLAAGYVVTDVEPSQSTVEVTGAASTMAQIADVRVLVQPEDANITESFTAEGTVVVVDESGEPLNVNVQPSQISVNMEVEGSTAEVPIRLEKVGTPEEGYDYSLSISEGDPQTIELFGDVDVIREIEEYPVRVDISGVTESASRRVPILLREGIIETDLDFLQVEIEVTEDSN